MTTHPHPDVNELLHQRARAVESATRLSLEVAAHREGGKVAPDALFATLGKAKQTVYDLDKDIAAARELEARGLVEVERMERHKPEDKASGKRWTR